jgi:hypothetical protein
MSSKYQPFLPTLSIIHFIRNNGKVGKMRLNLSGWHIVRYSHSSPSFLKIIGDSFVSPENTSKLPPTPTITQPDKFPFNFEIISSCLGEPNPTSKICGFASIISLTISSSF